MSLNSFFFELPIKHSCISPVSMMDIDEMMKIVSKTGYMVEKDLKRGMRVTVSSYFIDVFM